MRVKTSELQGSTVIEVGLGKVRLIIGLILIILGVIVLLIVRPVDVLGFGIAVVCFGFGIPLFHHGMRWARISFDKSTDMLRVESRKLGPTKTLSFDPKHVEAVEVLISSGGWGSVFLKTDSGRPRLIVDRLYDGDARSLATTLGKALHLEPSHVKEFEVSESTEDRLRIRLIHTEKGVLQQLDQPRFWFSERRFHEKSGGVVEIYINNRAEKLTLDGGRFSISFSNINEIWLQKLSYEVAIIKNVVGLRFLEEGVPRDFILIEGLDEDQMRDLAQILARAVKRDVIERKPLYESGSW